MAGELGRLRALWAERDRRYVYVRYGLSTAAASAVRATRRAEAMLLSGHERADALMQANGWEPPQAMR